MYFGCDVFNTLKGKQLMTQKMACPLFFLRENAVRIDKLFLQCQRKLPYFPNQWRLSQILKYLLRGCISYEQLYCKLLQICELSKRLSNRWISFCLKCEVKFQGKLRKVNSIQIKVFNKHNELFFICYCSIQLNFSQMRKYIFQ